MKMNGGLRHHVTSSVSLENWGKFIGNVVLKNGQPVDFSFVQQTSINRPNSLLEFETIYRF